MRSYIGGFWRGEHHATGKGEECVLDRTVKYIHLAVKWRGCISFLGLWSSITGENRSGKEGVWDSRGNFIKSVSVPAI